MTLQPIWFGAILLVAAGGHAQGVVGATKEASYDVRIISNGDEVDRRRTARLSACTVRCPSAEAYAAVDRMPGGKVTARGDTQIEPLIPCRNRGTRVEARY